MAKDAIHRQHKLIMCLYNRACCATLSDCDVQFQVKVRADHSCPRVAHDNKLRALICQREQANSGAPSSQGISVEGIVRILTCSPENDIYKGVPTRICCACCWRTRLRRRLMISTKVQRHRHYHQKGVRSWWAWRH